MLETKHELLVQSGTLTRGRGWRLWGLLNDWAGVRALRLLADVVDRPGAVLRLPEARVLASQGLVVGGDLHVGVAAAASVLQQADTGVSVCRCVGVSVCR